MTMSITAPGDRRIRAAVGPAPNADVARRLEEAGTLLEQQQASPFRVRAYQNAAAAVRAQPVSVDQLYRDGGLEELERIPGVGQSIARAIREVLLTGRLSMLERLRGESDPVHLFATVPGIGPRLADRLHEELGLATLEDLEAAAHDGRLGALPGFGARRVAGIIAALELRLGRARGGIPATAGAPPVAELLDVDREYRESAEAGRLPMITPRRFNPERKAWLPVLHASRGDRHYTALFSNTARAHRLERTHDWVVIYGDGDREERQATVVTAHAGLLAGRRVVRGREAECADFYYPPSHRHESMLKGVTP
jgi:predicted flap endonuclease-1-like 5' DNA nuclease